MPAEKTTPVHLALMPVQAGGFLVTNDTGPQFAGPLDECLAYMARAFLSLMAVQAPAAPTIPRDLQERADRLRGYSREEADARRYDVARWV